MNSLSIEFLKIRSFTSADAAPTGMKTMEYSSRDLKFSEVTSGFNFPNFNVFAATLETITFSDDFAGCQSNLTIP